MSGRHFGLVLTCEHASNALPEGVDLGLDPSVLGTHAAWDPFAREAALALAERTGAPLLLGRWSRLYVDLNRREENPQVLPTSAWGHLVPANADLPEEERQRRLDRWHRPWRRRVLEAVGSAIAGQGACLHISVHSFTPVLGEEIRDYDGGILFDPDRPWEAELARGLVQALEAAGLDFRENQPYPGIDDGMTTWLRERFPADRYAGIELELSQRSTAAQREQAIEVITTLSHNGAEARR